MKFLSALALTALLCANAYAGDVAPQRTVAVTFDDLPWVAADAIGWEREQQLFRSLVGKIRASGVPAMGFVNEGKLYRSGVLDPAELDLLREWLSAGLALGNHGYGHLSLHRVAATEWLADILRGEALTRPLLVEFGQELRYFRHPYLNTGRDAATRLQVAEFLAEHGYRVAPVTVDNADWIFAAAYRKAPSGKLRKKLERTFIEYMDRKFEYYEVQSRALLGYEPAQVLLLHGNDLNAACFDRLAARIERRGYRFVTLETALTDPAYQRRDGYFGGAGISWLHRWAYAEGKPSAFFAGEPTVARWVMELAGVESE